MNTIVDSIDLALGEALDYFPGLKYDDGPELAEFIADRVVKALIAKENDA